MSAFDFNPMKEDHRHRVLENGKRQGTKEKHGDEQKAADDLFLSEESPNFLY
jgi:hypothetical protein